LLSLSAASIFCLAEHHQTMSPPVTMPFYVAASLFLLSAWVAYKIVDSILTSRRHAKRAAELGCKPPPVFPTRWPFGLDFMWRLVKADRAGLLPPFTLIMYKEMGGATTHEQNFIGRIGLVTVDPKNIQAILATQFHDFALGQTRRGNFFPLLGNGIFTSDGKAW
jgi:hypothetical protein